MSVLTLSDKSINRAFNVITDLIYAAPVEISHHSTCRVHELRAINEAGAIPNFQNQGVEHLARWCAIFNLRNYSKRYAHLGEFHRVTYKFKPMKQKPITRLRLVQTLKTLECLQYNISDYYGSGQWWEQLLRVIDLVRDIIISELPEYEAAKWGE